MDDPPERLRGELEEARRRGVPFECAWPTALAGAIEGDGERDEWRAALVATCDSWRGAYAREPAPRAQRALALVGGDPERTVKLVGAGGICAHCGDPIGASRRPNAIYCGREVPAGRQRARGCVRATPAKSS